MLSYNEIKRMDTNHFNLYFKNTGIEKIHESIMIKFPDYYNLRGRDAQNISKEEKKELFKILKKELSIF